jgi:hypothetical protein
MKNNKTTIGGLLSSIGKGLTGAGVLTQLTQLLPASNVIPPSILVAVWWVTLVGVLLGVVGTTSPARLTRSTRWVPTPASRRQSKLFPNHNRRPRRLNRKTKTV